MESKCPDEILRMRWMNVLENTFSLCSVYMFFYGESVIFFSELSKITFFTSPLFRGFTVGKYMHHMGRAKRKCVIKQSAKCAHSHHPVHVQGLIQALALHWYNLKYTVYSDSCSGQQRPRSDCADAQADLSLCCPHYWHVFAWHGPIKPHHN